MRTHRFGLEITIVFLAFASTASAGPPEARYLYWTTNERGEIWRAHVDGRFVERLSVARTIRELALDEDNDRMYYAASHGGAGEIYRSRLDGTQREVLIRNADAAGDIELDAATGKLYWIEQGLGRLSRADADGGSREVLITGLGAADALALDAEAQRVYYEVGNAEIFSADFDGSNPTLFSSISDTEDIELDSAIDKVFSCHGNPSDGVQRCDLDGMNCSQLAASSCRDIALSEDTLFASLAGAVDPELWRYDLDGGNPMQLALPFVPPATFDFLPGQDRFVFVDRGIFRSELDGTAVTPLVDFIGNGAHDVAVDGPNEIFYVADYRHRAVIASPLAQPSYLRVSSNVSTEGVQFIRGLARDPQAQQLFFTNHFPNPDGGIWRANSDFSNLTEIVPGRRLPHDVALDLVNQKVYWTDRDIATPTTVIRRANLDGSTVEDLIPGLPIEVKGLDLDPVNGKLYWTDATNDEIHWAELDGSDPSTIVSGLDDPHDVAVDAASGHIYWTEGVDPNDNPTGALRRADLDGGSVTDILTGLSSQIRDLTLVQHRDLGIFADGFESGDTSGWSLP